jgi:hypothetical protein
MSVRTRRPSTGKTYRKEQVQEDQIRERPSTGKTKYKKEIVRERKSKVLEKPCTGKSSDKKTKQALGSPKVRALGGTKF